MTCHLWHVDPDVWHHTHTLLWMMKWCLLSLYTDFWWKDAHPVGFCTQYIASCISTLLRSTVCHITCCWCWDIVINPHLYNICTSVIASVPIFQPQKSISNTPRFHSYHRHLCKLLPVITKYFELLLSDVPYYERHYFWSNLHHWRELSFSEILLLRFI